MVDISQITREPEKRKKESFLKDNLLDSPQTVKKAESPKKKLITTSIKISEEEYTRYKVAAAKLRVSLSDLITNALSEYPLESKVGKL